MFPCERGFHIGRRRVQVDKFDRRPEARDRRDRRCPARPVAEIGAHAHRDLRLRDGLCPARDRGGRAVGQPRFLHHVADQRHRDREAFHRRLGAEPDLPTKRLLAGRNARTALLQLPHHAARDARIVPGIHGWLSVLR
jgi:hypothetical protein